MARRPSGTHIAAVGDVSGKGLPAALYMSQATALLTLSYLAGRARSVGPIDPSG